MLCGLSRQRCLKKLSIVPDPWSVPNKWQSSLSWWLIFSELFSVIPVYVRAVFNG